MKNKILNFFFPSDIYCIACGNLIDSSRPYSLCDNCMENIKWISSDSCEICGKSLGAASQISSVCFECAEVPHEFSQGFSCVTYEGPVKEILSGVKYKGRVYYIEKMAEIMADRAQGFINSIKTDIILPVPMYKKKQRRRGYNQSELLAKDVSTRLGIEYSSDVLLKKRDTSSMSSLNSAERRINLHNAFCLGYNKENDVVDKNVMIVDDVYTTGSTADACAEELKKEGASEVYFYTFASGVNMKPRKN